MIGFLVLSGCGSVTGRISSICGPNDVPLKYSEATINSMTDQQVKDTLAYNESLVQRGCAKPNKG